MKTLRREKSKKYFEKKVFFFVLKVCSKKQLSDDLEIIPLVALLRWESMLKDGERKSRKTKKSKQKRRFQESVKESIF